MVFKRIDINENIILKNKIPLLIEDDNWEKLFGNINNRDIIQIKQELDKLLKEQGELRKNGDILLKQKNLAMKMILGISNAINNENKIHSIELLDEYKEKIKRINDELEEISFRQESIPKQIRELNFDLLKTTIYYGYRELKTKEKHLKEITDELESMREEIKLLINQKYDYEEWINQTYSFFHNLLGSEEIEKIDEQIFK